MDHLLTFSKDNVMSKKRWELILQDKNRFLQSDDKEEQVYTNLHPEIVASWLRARGMNIDPYKPSIKQLLKPEQYQNILEENRLFIDIAKRLFYNFKTMLISSSCMLELINKQGICLLREGRLNLPVFALEGEVFNEHTMGTNAHNLSMVLKRPVQLLGPEHYCVDLHDFVASAAPILDESGDAIASLVLTQPLCEFPWEDRFQGLLSHTLSEIMAMTSAIESQMKLIKISETNKIVSKNLKSTSSTLEATLACVDEGIITIDGNGKIIRINQEGTRILKLEPEEIGKRNIMEYLDKNSALIKLAKKGEKTNSEETVFSGNDQRSYLVKIAPILGLNTRQVDAVVLRFRAEDKNNCRSNRQSGAEASFHFEDIVGEGRVIKNTITMAKRFANSPENMLLIGESGTGKELFAQAVHNYHCPQGPFIAVNCAAMPRELIESELFGYEGGSFTGAERSGKIGKIELAHGGTLFLDEIGDMPVELQAVLLRVLQDKQVMRVGGQRYKTVNFRVIAATNKDLQKRIADGIFREDLFFRLAILSIDVPPLRERGNDTKLLSSYFVEDYCHKLGWDVPQFSSDVQKIIEEYDWPGNVRQLENAMVYAVNNCIDGVIRSENLPNYIIAQYSSSQFDKRMLAGGQNDDMLSLRAIEKVAIENALLRTGNHVSNAANILGVSKSTLYRKLRDYNIHISE